MVARRFGFILVCVIFLGTASGGEPEGYVIEPPDIIRVVVDAVPANAELVNGQKLLEPDGTISLGDHGSVYVAGLTAEQAKAAITRQLAPQVKAVGPIRVQVDVVTPSSKVCYVIYPGKDGESLRRLPAADKPTVAAAILQVEGLANVATTGSVSISRTRGTETKVLEVDWRAITQDGKLATNHQLEPGDRVYIRNAKTNSDK